MFEVFIEGSRDRTNIHALVQVEDQTIKTINCHFIGSALNLCQK